VVTEFVGIVGQPTVVRLVPRLRPEFWVPPGALEKFRAACRGKCE
jgi:hypothetical protein